MWNGDPGLGLTRVGNDNSDDQAEDRAEDRAGVAELVDAVALGATVLRTCRFESCPRYHRSTAEERREAI